VDSHRNTQIGTKHYSEGNAVFSACGQYRYVLERRWSRRYGRAQSIAFIGLNPSTADATHNDPTIRKCMTYAARWGFSHMYMVNLFAWRATHPKDLIQTGHPIGDENDQYLDTTIANSAKIIACWGEHGIHRDRAAEIRSKFSRRLYCLKTNNSGEPAHPLYLPAKLNPVKLRTQRRLAT